MLATDPSGFQEKTGTEFHRGATKYESAGRTKSPPVQPSCSGTNLEIDSGKDVKKIETTP